MTDMPYPYQKFGYKFNTLLLTLSNIAKKEEKKVKKKLSERGVRPFG